VASVITRLAVLTAERTACRIRAPRPVNTASICPAAHACSRLELAGFLNDPVADAMCSRHRERTLEACVGWARHRSEQPSGHKPIEFARSSYARHLRRRHGLSPIIDGQPELLHPIEMRYVACDERQVVRDRGRCDQHVGHTD
jgi:hypothetical protein